ncbi:MAG: hypothetical protein NWE89_08940 [Candidatus Bathyarchaeota archaeon]|nr:hypothetical protein [Candidatus Bathyarchaeota archaeon]
MIHRYAFKPRLTASIIKRITEGKHKVAYFSRTAKGIITRDPEESLENFTAKFMEAKKHVKAKHPEFNIDQMRQLAEEYLRIKQRREKALGE